MHPIDVSTTKKELRKQHNEAEFSQTFGLSAEHVVFYFSSKNEFEKWLKRYGIQDKGFRYFKDRNPSKKMAVGYHLTKVAVIKDGKLFAKNSKELAHLVKSDQYLSKIT